jgi:hypothetical protein
MLPWLQKGSQTTKIRLSSECYSSPCSSGGTRFKSLAGSSHFVDRQPRAKSVFPGALGLAVAAAAPVAGHGAVGGTFCSFTGRPRNRTGGKLLVVSRQPEHARFDAILGHSVGNRPRLGGPVQSMLR